MATNETAFITRLRTVATQCIDLSNDFAGLLGEWDHRHYATELTAEHFGGANQDVTPEQVSAVMQALGVILGGITSEQKDAVYAVKV